MTPEQVLETLKTGLEAETKTLGFEDFDPIELGLGEYKIVHKTGGEDKGSNWSKVFHFPDHNSYIKVVGYYQSYSGTEFEEWDEAVGIVTPKEVTVIKYI